MNEDEKINLMLYIDSVIKEELEKIIVSSIDKITANIENRTTLALKTEKLVNRILSNSRINEARDRVIKTIDEYLKDLNDVVLMKKNIEDGIKKELLMAKTSALNSIENAVKKTLESELTNIRQKAEKAYELTSYIENAKDRIIDEIVIKATRRIKEEDIRPRNIYIYNEERQEKILDKDIYHSEFENIYRIVRLGLPVMLVGPTGSGKSICAKQVADALDMKMYYTNNASEEYKLLGFTDAHGKYKETQFYKAFKEGGLFFLDEIDNSHPSALLSLNSAIGSSSNGIYMAFEDGNLTQAHPNFRIIAAANTWGNGASRLYCGRSELDAASLDRFIQIYFDYDKKIEKVLIDDDELLYFFWAFRKIINELGIRHTITTRNIDYANKLKKAGFSLEQIFEYTIIKELDSEDIKLINEKFEIENSVESKYKDTLKKILVKRL